MPPLKLKQIPRILFVAAAVMVAGAAASMALKPTRMTADDRPPLRVEALLPSSFGDWQTDQHTAVVTPDPTLSAKLDALYSETFNRTYVNSKGQRIMLSIAYGRNQNSQSTAAHRPEFCYVAQGFNIKHEGFSTLNLPGHQPLKVARLLADLDNRIEPITYWVTLDDKAIMPGVERKLTQLQYGLRGLIADGMLVRVSSLVNSRQQLDYSLHDQFLADMEAAIPGGFKSRFFGS
ncbi:exosortase-associated protein EpsI, B-type [Aquabacterium soli]|jgi:EpsI family protein|nr:exosortase-associated protein EpsI, B-type [Aquabacterium soli]